MKVLLIVAGILLSLSCVYATDVSGPVSGTWTLASSPYRVIGDLTVPTGQTLEIQPGVVVNFVGRYQFLVNGTLNAHGTAADSIRFTIDTVAYPNKWLGIRLVGANDSSRISFCIVENAYWPNTDPNSAGGGISMWDCSPRIEHSTIRRCMAGRNGGGMVVYSSNAQISDCRIAHNYAPYGGGVQCGAATGLTAQALFRSCAIERNQAGQGGGIGCWPGSAITVTNCTIVNNHGNDAGGLRLCGDATAAVTNSIFTGNSLRAITNLNTSTTQIDYSCFWQNAVSGNLPTGFGTLVMRNSNLDSCDTYHNIFFNPNFVDNTTGDYHLQAGSKCINAGDHNSPYDPDGTVTDMGAFWRSMFTGGTEVCGNISGTWTTANSPYYVTCNVTVPTGQTLSIQPGVQVIFGGAYQFLVNGMLNAQGTATDSIRFTIDTLAYPGKWLGIRLVGATDSVRISYCVVENAYWSNRDQSTAGGGISMWDCNPLIAHTTIRRCSSAANGGGMVVYNSNAQISDCRIANNHASYGGGVQSGAASGQTMHAAFRGCAIERNSAGQGGGIGCWPGSAINITNCTIVNNQGDDAGGLRLCGTATAVVMNSIFTGNSLRAVTNFNTSTTQISYSCFWENAVSGNVPAGFGTLVMRNSNLDSCDIYHNIFFNPNFVNNTTGDYHLQAGSKCINAGNHNSPNDPDGTVADMGAFWRSMFTGGTEVCGNISGTWTTANSPYYVTCDVTVPTGQTLSIQPGVQVIFGGRYQFLVNGILNARGTETDSIRFTIDTLAYPNKWSGIRFIGASDSSVLSYCRVEYAFWPDQDANTAGGGVTCWSCSPLIEHSTIQFCRSARIGGGMKLMNSSARIIGCRIADSYAPYGGGIECGAVGIFTSRPEIDHCVIEHNSAGQGGGIGCWNQSELTVTNCTIVGNHGDDAGGIRLCCGATAAITNSIIAANTIRAVYILDNSIAQMSYSCFWQNTVSGNVPAGFDTLVMRNANLDSCDIYHNIFLDPEFVSAETGDYRLQTDSPCINAGDPNTPRDPDGTVADMGAFHRSTLDEGVAYVSLISAGPPSWKYRLHCTEGTVSKVVFTDFCPGTTGSVSGAAAANWQVMYNGDGNDGDSIIFLASYPMSTGTLDTFKLSDTTCAGQVRWCVGDSCGVLDGPSPNDMLNFVGTAGDSRVALEWSTASEPEVASFEILRDGVPIARIPATGNPLTGANYRNSDTGLINGREYHYSLAAIGVNGAREILAELNATPSGEARLITDYALNQNYPNPFNPRTTISFDIVEAGTVTLAVFNVMGQQVASLVNGRMEAGRHQVIFDATRLPSGLYIYRLNVNNFESKKKMLLLK